MKLINNVINMYRELNPADKTNLVRLSITYFFVLFTYPLLRATTVALYIQTFGARATPVVWFLSVFVLSFVIFFYNKIQKKVGVHELFLFTAILSIVIFLVSLLAVHYGIKEFAYALYIWKEIYIVMLIGMVLGYANNFLKIDQAKVFFGVIGGSGSLGGITGGLLTSYLSKKWGIEVCILLATLVIAINAWLFFRTDRLDNEKQSMKDSVSPILALKGAGKYVACIALMVGFSQFCINIANLEFNLIFEKIVTNVDDKAGYLGTFFAMVNFITLVIQAVVLPIFLSRFNMKSIHIFIPAIYFIVIFMGLGLGANILWAVGGTFVILKGVDYSLFNVAKDILLYPLTPLQKYGAKYLSDMIVYRFAKALISLFLIYYQDIKVLNIMMAVFLLLWFFTILKLYVYQKILVETKQ